MLEAPFNNITGITGFYQSLTSLTEVNLSNNPITEWSDVCRLSSILPNLKTLALNECSIKNIEFPKDDTSNMKEKSIESNATWFPSLSMLQISSCKIDNWASVEALNVLSLAHLKFKFNPILETESRETCRQLTIAAIKSLTYLNGSYIEKQE